MKKNVFYFFIILSMSSCLTTKQTTNFQGEISDKVTLHKMENKPYKLQVNDVLSISIKAENPKLVALFNTSSISESNNINSNGLYFNGYSVDRHGNIRIPYIGELNVLGYTEKEVREKIENSLKDFIKNPETIFVTVKLEGIKFIVSGEVNSPGTVILQQNQVSIVEALANAGDISSYGDRKNIQIIRKSLDGVQRFSVDITDIAVFSSDNFYIQPNDVIYIPPLPQKSWGTGTTGFQTFTTIVSVLSFLATSVILVKNL